MDTAAVMEHDGSVVHAFYHDTTVLITGGTGFIGKVLVEKLLRSFSVKTIYLLIRSKNDLSVNERLQEFFKESVRIRRNSNTRMHLITI